mgnify:CR=1 FL=1
MMIMWSPRREGGFTLGTWYFPHKDDTNADNGANEHGLYKLYTM